MEVALPSRPALDFDFNSARSSPCMTAPSTPRRFGNYSFLSAPTSPSRISEFYREFDAFSVVSSTWEEEEDEKDDEHEHAAPRKSSKQDEFAFDVGEEVDRDSVSAEELIDGGVLRPFKASLPAPQSSSTKKIMNIRQALSPRRKKETRITESTRNNSPVSSQQQRGRERAPSNLTSSSRRASRSLSPLRVSEFNWAQEEEEQKRQQAAAQNEIKQLATKGGGSSLMSSAAAVFSSKASRKWRLKDFLLFRSASEGRASDKDPFSKFSNNKNEYVKTASSSFRLIDSPASVSSARRKGPSAHELHYTVNKAVSNDMKKKTFLPYKQGILGRLAFNPAVHSLSTGFGTLSRS